LLRSVNGAHQCAGFWILELKVTLRIIRAGVAGAIAWWAGLMLLFGGAQGVLGHPALQSSKLNAIYEMPPPPRIASEPWLLPLGILVVALIHAATFAYIRLALPRGIVRRGLAFAAISWALLVPWFEFYLPWNLMLEPTALVLLEMVIWAGVLMMVGIAISFGLGHDANEQLPRPTGQTR
jgi:hypothetical protein